MASPAVAPARMPRPRTGGDPLLADPLDYARALEVMVREARGEGELGMRAVLHALLNRTRAGAFGTTIETVAIRRTWVERNKAYTYHFTCFDPRDPNAKHTPRPDEHAYVVACEILRDPGEDVTRGADHYHRVGLQPSWAQPARKTVTIGNHVFYKLLNR